MYHKLIAIAACSQFCCTFYHILTANRNLSFITLLTLPLLLILLNQLTWTITWFGHLDYLKLDLHKSSSALARSNVDYTNTASDITTVRTPTTSAAEFRPITRWKDAILMTAYRKGIYGDSLKDLIGDELDDYAWRLGDYCKAMYSGDGLFYECKITAMFSNFCTVKFLGYDNTEDVRIEDLRETDGKQARREQIRIAKAILDENVDEDGDSSDLDDFLPMRMRRARQSAADGVVCADHSPGRICRASQSAADGAVCADHSHRRCHASHCATAPSVSANQSFMPPPTSMPQGPASLAPFTLPQCPGLHGPPMLPQGPGPHAPPMLPQGTGPHAPPVMPQGTGPHAPPVMPQGTGPHAPPVMPQSPGPHAPPMLPQVPGIQSPPMLPQGPVPPNEMPGILNAWYMAGYYTGLHHFEDEIAAGRITTTQGRNLQEGQELERLLHHLHRLDETLPKEGAMDAIAAATIPISAFHIKK
ncbi:uncharacterized protein LOC129960219 isoform X2 [Argiope bruennichi]|uniref:uncharacterized protein LOC129960219 isoform X2 n=1 Tax=Argiope bruennichi TaxID=94029 RepID=UPI00249547F6|nr:uncharacterized protein LOC129960219 isoform X2 [Argiope bruennichi]